MLMDNGSPWGLDSKQIYTPLTVWMIRLGIGAGHGRGSHLQTPGKDERLPGHLTWRSFAVARSTTTATYRGTSIGGAMDTTWSGHTRP